VKKITEYGPDRYGNGLSCMGCNLECYQIHNNAELKTVLLLMIWNNLPQEFVDITAIILFCDRLRLLLELVDILNTV